MFRVSVTAARLPNPSTQMIRRFIEPQSLPFFLGTLNDSVFRLHARKQSEKYSWIEHGITPFAR
jgi:hypothetical protein